MAPCELQLTSHADWSSRLDPAQAAAVTVRLAEVMGLYARAPDERIDRALVKSIILAAVAAGIPPGLVARTDSSEPDDETTAAFLVQLLATPLPATEIPKLADLLSYRGLARLIGRSESSLRRYSSGSRPTPHRVARRAHFIGVLVAILSGSFNSEGVRRWLERPHPALRGKPPADVLSRPFDPDDRAARTVLAAASTVGSDS